MTLHRNLVAREGWNDSRETFRRLMTSLYGGPWTGLTLEEGINRLLYNYALNNDLESALGTLEIPPARADKADDINQEDDFVNIGGVKLKVR